MNQVLIYGLIDPVTKYLRYVGLTKKGISRAQEHLTPSRYQKDKTYKGKWIRSCIKSGYLPEIVIIEELQSSKDLADQEQFYITYFKSLGCPLTNLTEGGEGVLGYRFTHEQKIMISERTKIGMTREVRKKLALQKMNKPAKNRIRVKDQFGKIYLSLTDAANQIGVTISAISMAINKRPVKGFTLETI